VRRHCRSCSGRLVANRATAHRYRRLACPAVMQQLPNRARCIIPRAEDGVDTSPFESRRCDQALIYRDTRPESVAKNSSRWQSQFAIGWRGDRRGKNAEVVVTLESAVAQVVVSGAVAKPAKLLFERPTTVFQAIMEAGGLNEYGSFKNVHVIRLIGGRQRTQILDLRPTLSGQATQPFYVKDGDVIYVPPSPF